MVKNGAGLMNREEVENLIEHYREKEPEQAKLRKVVIERLREESKVPMTAAEIREEVASYIAAEMPDYSREEIDEYLNREHGVISS